MTVSQSCLTLCHPMERNTNKNHILTSMAIIKKSVKKTNAGESWGKGISPYTIVHAGVLSRFRRVRLCVNLRTVTHQAPLSMGFSRQEYWSGLPRPPPGDLPNQGLNLRLTCPALAGRFFTISATSATWEAPLRYWWECELV